MKSKPRSTPVKSKPRSTLDLSIEPPRKKSRCTKVNIAAKKLVSKKYQKQATEKGVCIDLDKYVPSTKDVNVWISNKKLKQDRDILLNPTGWLNTSNHLGCTDIVEGRVQSNRSGYSECEWVTVTPS